MRPSAAEPTLRSATWMPRTPAQTTPLPQPYGMGGQANPHRAYAPDLTEKSGHPSGHDCIGLLSAAAPLRICFLPYCARPDFSGCGGCQ